MTRSNRLLLVATLTLLFWGTAGAQATPQPIQTTLRDWLMPGTQPESLVEPVIAGNGCTLCHGYFNYESEPFARWQTTLMAQSSRDPLFHACLAIAEQDAQFSGELCLRCHTPSAWLEGRSVPTDGSAVSGINDFDGITCNLCHRMVDPYYEAGVSPSSDLGILSQLSQIPDPPHSGQYVIDPQDVRRGPYTLSGGFSWHNWAQSPFHRESLMCGTCHDISNPAFIRQGDSFILGDLDVEHPDHDPANQFPIERTYSEWSQSAFALGPVEMGGRFGGNISAVSSCQDCHMPKTTGSACALGGVVRPDQPQHNFSGASTWILDAIHQLDISFLLWDTPAFMNPDWIDLTQERNVAFLQAASDIEVETLEDTLRVRVINQSGHKLPTGYPEGRRIWIETRMIAPDGTLLAHHGAYDFESAQLEASTSTVFEVKLGLDQYMAGVTGLPEGPSFHFALNNKIYKDNRIPPRGFTNSGFESVQAKPVGTTYEDGQYWHDSFFDFPQGASTIEVRLWYQTASKEYIEFLADNNETNDAGQILYEQWQMWGKGPPVLMDEVILTYGEEPFIRGDSNFDGVIDISDPISLLQVLFAGVPENSCPDSNDANDDEMVDLADAISLLTALFGGGNPPPAPHPGCAVDPTPGPLPCWQFPCP